MNRLWLFFPENDIALAHGVGNFTPPPAALKLHRSGEILPIWMVSPGDKILCHGINKKWLDEIRNTYNIDAGVWDHINYDLIPTPWGWSDAAAEVFLHEGFMQSALPAHELLCRYRELSHRRTAFIINNEVSKTLPFYIYPPALECSDTHTLAEFIKGKRSVVIKSPWSSSGRGVRFVDSEHITSAITAAEGTIRKQGSIMVEEMIRPHFDFALLFYCRDGIADFKGYSLFSTNPINGQYTGNIVASQDRLFERISSYVYRDHITTLITALEQALGKIIAPLYTGPVGVDMLADESGRMHIAEINLRYTMGFLSLQLAKFVAYEAIFHIEPGCNAQYEKPVVENARLVHGTQLLTPPGGDFSFILRAK